MKKVIVIGGGETFKDYPGYIEFLTNLKLDLDKPDFKDWKANLQEDLGDEYKVIRINMPNKFNSKYKEWKIWFDKYRPLIDNETIFIGHSLGALFLHLYVRENPFPFKKIFFVAAPYGECDDFHLPTMAPQEMYTALNDKQEYLYFYHSKDDKIVPLSNFNYYTVNYGNLKSPNTRVFEDRGHFFSQEHLPEIVEDIKTR